MLESYLITRARKQCGNAILQVEYYKEAPTGDTGFCIEVLKSDGDAMIWLDNIDQLKSLVKAVEELLSELPPR